MSTEKAKKAALQLKTIAKKAAKRNPVIANPSDILKTPIRIQEITPP